jgi:ABC-2 type transport system permease protein
MKRALPLIATEARLLVRDWNVLVFAFVFPPFVMLILAGVFGTQPSGGFGHRRPDDYYVAASIGVPVIALGLVGLPVALAGYRERGVLRRLEAFGISRLAVVGAQAVVTCGLVLVGAAIVLALALPTYGVPHLVHPAATLAGLAVSMVTLMVLGIAIGLAAPSARAAQAIGLLAFFPLYLLGGGGPPRGAMTGAMHVISDVIPSAVPAVVEPWLGLSGLGSQLLVLAGWAAVALAVTVWLARRTAA